MGGGQVAERLADPGSRLRQQQVRYPALRAGCEHAARLARITTLALAALGAFAGQAGETGLDFLFLD